MNSATPHGLVRLAHGHFWIILAGLMVVSIATVVAVWPLPYVVYCAHSYIPSAQTRWGFTAGRLPLTRPSGDGAFFAITEVARGGRFDHLGFRSGDVPVDHHGGLIAFCSALRSAAHGEPADVVVVNADAWSAPNGRRHVVISQ